jgi:hypothetical protein
MLRSQRLAALSAVLRAARLHSLPAAPEEREDAHQTAGMSGIAASGGAGAPSRRGWTISVFNTSFVRVSRSA